jgi:hypothetical protein
MENGQMCIIADYIKTGTLSSTMDSEDGKSIFSINLNESKIISSELCMEHPELADNISPASLIIDQNGLFTITSQKLNIINDTTIIKSQDYKWISKEIVADEAEAITKSYKCYKITGARTPSGLYNIRAKAGKSGDIYGKF